MISRIFSIFTIDSNHYLLGLDQISSKTCLFKRQKIDEKVLENKEEIVIATCYMDDWKIDILKDAMLLFERFNPEVNIKVIDEGDLSVEQYFKIINTELMVGKGPDIFYGDFPYESYLDKDVLLDLNQYINNDNGDYYENILEAVKYDGKQYLFPINFRVSTLFLNKKIAEEYDIQINNENWTIEETENLIMKICKEDTGYYGFDEMSFLTVAWYVINTNIEQFIDFDKKEVNFNTVEFRNLLESFKNIKSKNMPRNLEGTNELFDSVLFRVYSYGYASFGCLSQERGRSKNYIILDMPKLGDGDKETFSAFFSAVNANTKNKDLAIKIIEFLASEGCQLKYKLKTGFHINKNIQEWDRKLNLTGKVEPFKDIHEDFGIRPDNIKEENLLTQDELDKFDETIKSRNYYNHKKLYYYDELDNYLDDKQDLDTTIMNIQNKAELFIGE